MRVEWLCVDGPAEWIGTQISFDLSRQDDQTILIFGHRGWREAVEFMAPIRDIMSAVSQQVLSHGKIMEGVPAILDFFKERGLKIGLASSSPTRFIQLVLDHFGLAGYFDAIASAEREPYGKPHPAVYLSCAGQLKSVPLHCMAFEDSINGMIAAKAARMKVVAVPEVHNLQNPKYVLADLKLNKLAEFTAMYLEHLNNY